MAGKINKRGALPAGFAAVGVLLWRLMDASQQTMQAVSMWPETLRSLAEAAFAGAVAWLAFAYYRRGWCINASVPMVDTAVLRDRRDGTAVLELTISFSLTDERGVGPFDVTRGVVLICLSGDNPEKPSAAISTHVHPENQTLGRVKGERLVLRVDVDISQDRREFLRLRDMAFARLIKAEVVTTRGTLAGSAPSFGLEIGHATP